MENKINVYQHIGGIVTGTVVTSISAWVLWSSHLLVEALAWQGVILFLILLISSPRLKIVRPEWGKYAFYLMLPVTFALSIRVHIDVFFIYSIIWIAYAPTYLSRSLAWWSLLAVGLSWFGLRVIFTEETNVLAKTILESTFHMFALISSIATLESIKANEKTQQLNRDLLATQLLLSDASKESERTRIARDLHDLLGHHLTALTINLQVAGRLSSGEAKNHIDQCYALSKLLLSDVREAVSTLKTMPIVNLKELLEIATKDVPRLSVSIQLDDDMVLDDVNVAESLLRIVQEAITNTLKHNDASTASIEVQSHDQVITLRYSDSGIGCESLKLGNGLKGMQERLQKIGGTLSLTAQPSFSITANFPLSSNELNTKNRNRNAN